MATRIACAQLNQIIGDFDGNLARIAASAEQAVAASASVLLTPELSLTGYPPEDLLLRESFYDRCDRALAQLRERTAHLSQLAIVVGHPLRERNARYNAATVIRGGREIGRYRKQELPNYEVFDERRY
ncbi:MAG TPA: nitrilase-related carbon-nitrogen hydrolase, partial [Burkholderiaceae bacterium]|nr:nitrilase-related carbon-nitrogen hydrolase [Burkholderiaceae bacterium]